MEGTFPRTTTITITRCQQWGPTAWCGTITLQYGAELWDVYEATVFSWTERGCRARAEAKAHTFLGALERREASYQYTYDPIAPERGDTPIPLPPPPLAKPARGW